MFGLLSSYLESTVIIMRVDYISAKKHEKITIRTFSIKSKKMSQFICKFIIIDVWSKSKTTAIQKYNYTIVYELFWQFTKFEL